MALGLQGKVTLVTASSEGLGLACAERFAAEGCSVALCGRRVDVLENARAKLAKGGCDVLAVPADLAVAGEIENFVAQVKACFGRIDILVVNSGHADYGGLEDLSDAQWQHAYDLFLMSAVRLTRAVIPLMRTNKGGDIVILSSSTVKEPPPHLILSSVMRLGVIGLAKTLARSLAPENIRVNVVAPGYFDTGRVHKRVRALMDEQQLTHEAAASEISGGVPLGRIGTAEELAELVAFVASRKAGFMTGSIVAIDGGGSRAVF
jgi:3-oxoacyl-[acyl-carrier protein] reductase